LAAKYAASERGHSLRSQPILYNSSKPGPGFFFG